MPVKKKKKKYEGVIFASVKQAQRRCCYWQGILGLADWDIIVEIVHKDRMPLDAQGWCNPYLSSKQALIQLCDYHDYPVDTPWPLDQESVLVHELLHIHFEHAGIKEGPDGKFPIMAHQSVESIARAFISLERG